MENGDEKITEQSPSPETSHRAPNRSPVAVGNEVSEAEKGAAARERIDNLTDQLKRALAETENARKRANAARAEGREQGVAVAIAALIPAFDALALGIETARTDPGCGDPRIAQHLEGLRHIRDVFETGLKALGVRIIAPKDTPFDPALHEALQMQETAETAPGQILILHRPGFALNQRLIRPAHVTVSASPAAEPEAG
ncbi:nucleotide exchange factor GrpE [Sulfitobacter aestuarii]|uniref:Protein GrpE n=1 Tax=Sulfitobacter aestuarii TaxID=2161676 RepID=A0ABW5U4C2_9RHOB